MLCDTAPGLVVYVSASGREGSNGVGDSYQPKIGAVAEKEWTSSARSRGVKAVKGFAKKNVNVESVRPSPPRAGVRVWA